MLARKCYVHSRVDQERTARYGPDWYETASNGGDVRQLRIPSEERLRALERFVRLDEGRARGEGGTGLGLAIVHEVTVAHGGHVDLDTSALGGLRVTVTLPATQRSARRQAGTPTMDVTRRP
jgi:hypothetical protein